MSLRLRLLLTLAPLFVLGLIAADVGTYTALQNFDYPVIEAVTLVSTIAFVVVNLCVDLLYPVIDPRIRRNG